MRKHNYAVGYRGKGQCIYGSKNESLDLLTYIQAKKAKKTFMKPKLIAIYKLVEVKPL